MVTGEHMLSEPLGILLNSKATDNHIIGFGLILGLGYAGCDGSDQDEEIPQSGRGGSTYRHREANVNRKTNKTSDTLFLSTLFSIALQEFLKIQSG
jgi:hypothetical protein